MKRKFTFLITAAVMLLTIMASTGTMWGQTEILNEPFNISGTNEVSSPYNGWAITRCWGGDGSIRLGASSGDKGQIISPALTTLSGNATMTFEVKRYGTDTGSIGISIEEGDGAVTGDVTVASSSISADSWTTKTVTITGGSSTTKIKFLLSNKRMYLRNVIIVPSSGGNPTAANIAALTANTTAGDYELTLSNAIVTYVNGNYAYVQDASGAVQYFKNGHGLNAGDVLTGTAIVSYQLNNNNPRITNLQGITPVSGTAPEPTSLAQSAWNHTFNAVLSQYFQITGATLTKTGNYYYIALGDDNVQLYKNGGSISTLDLSKTYTVVGFPMLYNSTKEILVFENPQVEVSTDPTITVDPVALSNFTYEEGNGPSTVKTISVSGSNLTANIGLSLGDNSDYEMSTTEGSGYTNSLTLTQTGGTVNATTVYVRLKADLAVSASYSGTITLTSTDATPVTVSLSGSVTAPEAPHVTWDLSIASYDEIIDPDIVTWSSSYATMTNSSKSGGTSASNYLGGDSNNRTSSRFYSGNTLTLAPVLGYSITSAVFTATSENYATALQGSTWTNATASKEGMTVTVTPTNGNDAMVAAIGGTCGFTEVKVYYQQVQIQDYELEIMAEHGTVTVAIGENVQTGNNGSYQIPQGSVVTLTATPASNYRFKQWNITPNEGTLTIENGQFTMPACYVLVEAVFESIPNYLYGFSENGTTGTPVEVPEGTEITLPSTVANVPAGFTFAGWTTDANDVANASILAPGASYIVDATVEFFAVYSKTVSGSPVTAFNKVTSISAGDYLIVYETGNVAFDGGRDNDEDKIDAVGNTIDITEFLSNGVISSNSTTNAAIFIIAESESKDDPTYTIQSASGFYIGKTTTGNGMMVDATTKYTNSISFDDSGNAVITASSGVTLRYNNASNQLRFRYFGSGQQAIQLYKRTTTVPSVTTYYTRVFQNITATADIKITGPSIIASGSTMNMNGHTLAYKSGSTITNMVIDDGAKYVGNSVTATVQKNIDACDYSNQNNAGYYLIASPIYDALTSSAVNGLLTSQYDLYKFDNTSDKPWINYKDTNDGGFTIDAEVGYLYASGSNTTIKFDGELNEADNGGTYTTTVSNKGYNLIGNPLPCDVTTNTSYLVLNDVGSAFVAGSAIHSCDAILVETEVNGEEVVFTQVTSRGGVPSLTMNVTQPKLGLIDNARIRFDQQHGIGKYYLNENDTRIYIAQNGRDMAVISGEAQGQMPVCFKAAENGTYTISVEAENLDVNYLHLIDNKTGMDVDLLATPSYTFEGKRTDYASRFRLVFDTNAGNNETSEEFAFISDGNIVIVNDGEATLQVIDMLGRIVSSQTVNGNASIDKMNANGVYVLRLINGNNVKTQKIVVK